MKHITDFDNIPTNFYTRTSRNKYNDSNFIPISKIDDYQTSMSAFSTRIETKNNLTNSIERKKSKTGKKKVEFNPLISIINIESFKKENYVGNIEEEKDCYSEYFKKENEKKCIICSIF